MQQRVNSVYQDLFTKKPRYFILMGGRGAGRSTVASQLANSRLIAPEYFRCAIMRYILGDIRNSIYREITDRAEENGIIDKLKINESTMSIEYGPNSINAVGFKKSSGDQKSKLKSLANYNCVIIEEADEIPEEDFMQLDDSLRTIKGDITVILLLNPPAKTHWIIQRWFDLFPSETKDFYIPKLKPEMTDTVFISTNYLDNIKNIDAKTAENYERYKETKPSHYYNIVRGYVPETVRGKIYSGWVKIPTVPHEARLERYGLDFGFTNDPTAIVAVYKYNGGFIFDEVLYRKGMLNKPIADILLNEPQALVVADQEDPKSITELNTYGLSVIPCKKGKDSVRFGIATVQQQRCSVTERSIHIWEEYMNYSWLENKDGQTLNEPKPGYDHCFVGDTLINTNNGLVPIKNVSVGDEVLTSRGYRKVLLKHNNGLKQVYKYRLQLDTQDDIIISCTPTHKVKTNKGWVQISKLKSGMMVTLTKSLMEKSIKYTQKKDIFQNTLQECTRLFGNIIMEKFLKGFTFIIKTKTHGITQLQTLNSLLDQNTYQNMQNVELKKTQNGLLVFKKKALKEQNSGEKIIQKKQVRSTQKLLKKDGEVNVVKNLSSTVKYVLKNIRHHFHKEVNTVIITARLKHLDVEGSWNERVYDLTVEDNHEYFANGLLVHNCLDAIRYAIKNLIPDDTIPKKQFSGQSILDELLTEDY